MGVPLSIAPLLSLLGAPANEQLAAPQLEIVIEEDGGCLSSEDLERGIAETLALDDEPAPTAAQAWRIEVRAHRQGAGYEATIAVHGEAGQGSAASGAKRRNLEIDHDSCNEVRDAVVLVSALLVDELWAENRTLHAQVTPQPLPTPAVPQTSARAPKPSPPPPAAPPRWTVLSTALALMTVGDLPRTAGGVGLRVGFDAPRVIGFHVTAIAWPRRDIRDEMRQGARFSAYEIGAAACPRVLGRPRLELVACAGARAGAIHARGLGLDSTQGSTRPRALVDAGVGVRIRIGGPVWLGAGAGAGVPIVRDRFVYGDAGMPVLVHRSWPVVPIFELSLSVRSVLARAAARARASPRKTASLVPSDPERHDPGWIRRIRPWRHQPM